MHASTAGAEQLVAGFNPETARNLAVRNLLRSLQLGLPSGQEVARAIGIDPLEDEDLFTGIEIGADPRDDFAGHAPLWFYVLKEAEILAGGAHLGPVGGRIVAEVLIGLLAGDPLSYLGVNPNWKPTLPGASANAFTLSDLINHRDPDAGGSPTPALRGVTGELRLRCSPQEVCQRRVIRDLSRLRRAVALENRH
jgi:hypothetical protein